MLSKSTTREDKAIGLIDSGAVTLNLDGTATVRGSGKAEYLVIKEGCPCPDYTQRGELVGPCKHLLAVKALCKVYRACREEARRTGRTRLPANLAKALPCGRVAAPAVKVTVEDILWVPSDLAAAAPTGGRDVALVIDGEPVPSGLDRFLPGDVDDEHDLLGSQDLDSDPYEDDWDEVAA